MTTAQLAIAIAAGLFIAVALILGFGLGKMAKLSDDQDDEPYGDFPNVPR